MGKVVNWGILGAANFARNYMARAIHAAERGRLAALATGSADKAAGFSAFQPDLRVHDSYEALLADDSIDAVYIPLPNHLHVDWTLKALAAGKHVLCEKPLALRADAFDAVIAAADAADRLCSEAYMIVHHPQWQMARKLYQDGALGTIRRVAGAFSYDNSADGGNIRNRPDTGGGALPDIGVYIFGATRYVTGEEPEAILSSAIEWENDVDVWSHVTARFPSFHYSGVVSMRMQPWQEMVFHGTDAVMTLTAPFNPGVYGEARLTLHRGMEVTEHRFPSAQHYVAQVEAFNASVLDGAAYPSDLAFAKGTQRMIDMVFDHAKAQG